MNPLDFLVSALAAFGAGALNSVAGGGSFLTFPSLILAGLDDLHANATSTVALWPGSLASVVGYRKDLVPLRQLVAPFAGVSLLGGGVGAALLVWTPGAVFAAILPFLLLAATLVFTLGPRLTRPPAPGDGPVTVTPPAIAAQFLVAVYGGYFGGGIGLLMLAAFTLLGLRDLHAMNGLKALLGALINGVAVVAFLFAGLVHVPMAAVMSVGAIAGGWGGAALVRRWPAPLVRKGVVVFAWSMTAIFFVRRFA